ncbi:right-handed parallel beta-helix repeat-containing protein [bacterium]|nr:right-handed parallel beta-helix repeat-containing protein [bacterium]
MEKRLKFLFLLLTMGVVSLYAENTGYQEWLKKKESLIKDKSVARYYTFEDVKDSKSIVKDLSGNNGDLKFVPYINRQTKEVFDDLKVVEGRWSDKKAVRLDRGWYQGATFNIQDKQFSAEVWFRRQGLGSILPASKLNNGHLMSVSGYRQGWRLITSYNPSSITYALGGEGGSGKAGASLSKRIAIQDNMWQYIAITWDGKEMKLYLNGKHIASNKFEKDYLPVERPELFKIGFSELGIGSLITDIDEVVVYNRVLTEEEIEERGMGPKGLSEKDVFQKADFFVKKGDFQQARAEYEKLKHLPNYGKELSLFNIAESYRLEKDYNNAHKTYNEINSYEKLSHNYKVYALFREAEVYLEEKNFVKARECYGKILKKNTSNYHGFKAELLIGDMWKNEKKYSVARTIYTNLFIKEESSSFPNDGNRLDIRNRLEEIEGLADGKELKSPRQKRVEWVNSPKYEIYVSLKGNDNNRGTKDKPFATIKRAQEEVRKIKEKGIPAGGISVYLRGGNYFITDGIVFDTQDSGAEFSPIVYRGYQGEKVRIIGGKQVSNFKPLKDLDIIKRLPKESKDKVWVADLKEAGITEYGQLLPRGFPVANQGALELIFNEKIMKLAQWPNNDWVRVAGLAKVDGVSRNAEFGEGKFIYSGDRPERWKDEKDMWVKGYLGVVQPYIMVHSQIKSIDTEKKIIDLMPNTYPRARWKETRVAKDHPYFVYNILSELDMPGEFYLDRSSGKLYFYPPQDITKSEVIVTTLDKPVFTFNKTSNIVLYNITIEGTWQHGIVINGGRNNLIAGSVIRNTGQWAVVIDEGWDNKVVGCDMYDMGEGGVNLKPLAVRGVMPFRKELIPARHLVENNHIHRFNRFCGGYRQGVSVNGIGQIVSHNVIHDSPHQMIYFNANDHIIEFNELHDGPYEGREIGAMYIYGEPWYLMSRGTVTRNNFFHHISTHSSPNLTHGLNAIHVDAMNAGLVFVDNIFYRVPTGISSTYPGNYITNNMFIDIEGRGVGQGDRSNIFCNNQDIDGGPNLRMMSGMSQRLQELRYKQPPWSYRYPPLINMLEREPSSWGSIQGSVIERNFNTGGAFISFGRGTQASTHFKNNWDGQEPLFMDKENMDFRLRPGAPIYGLTGYEPINISSIGVYKDQLRASWPINRTKEDIGKYYKSDWSPLGEMKATMSVVKRKSPALTYTIPKRKLPVTIDGNLNKEEWSGLDKKTSMVIEKYYTGDDAKKGAKSFVWMQYDKDYLYVGIINEPDPWMDGMRESLKRHLPVVEISLESQIGSHSRGWWLEDMPTGPIYVLWGKFDGKAEVKNNFGMPFKSVNELEKSIEFKVKITDNSTQAWQAEMKIPFNKIGIDPSEVDKLAFNIGTNKRTGWFVWIPTGASVWRLENAGFIQFKK